MHLHDRLTDAGLAAGFAVALAVQAFAVADTWGGGYWVFGCAAGTVVCVLAMARRHRWAAGAGLAVATGAFLVAWLADLPGEPGPATAIGLSVLVGAAVRARLVGPTGAVVVGWLAVIAVGWFAAPRAAVPNALALLAALATGFGLRLLDTRNRGLAETVRQEERMELARELHDVVAHHVTGIVLQAQAARVVRRRHPEKLDESLTGIEAAGSDALAAMRRIVGLLRDSEDAAPATAGPERLTELVERFDGPAVRLSLPGGEPAWPQEVTSTVYRVVQESLTNVARHAPRAGSVTVTVAEDQRTVTVEVVDDGPPARAHRGGYGLVGMRERVEALGGTLSAGWTVRATVPLGER